MYSENIKFGKSGVEFTDKHGKRLTTGAAFSKAFGRAGAWISDLKLYVLHSTSAHLPFHSLRKAIFTISGVKIGRGSALHMGVKFFEPRGVEVGEDTMIGQGTFLDGRAKLKIGDHVDLASEVMIYNSEHDLSDREFKAVNEEVVIENYVFVGPRAIILPGVHIGEGSVVAAGAVVTRDVPPYTIVAGIPAKKIGERKLRNLNYRLGRPRLFQ